MRFEKLMALLLEAFTSTFSQLAGILGIFFIFGSILYLLERMTTISFIKSIGWRGILFTAWLGTPIHEFGHALFCYLFGHKVTEIQFYKPDKYTGILGYVSHVYNKNNIIHQIGNFFIGAAPLIIGSIVMYLALYLLVPNAERVIGEAIRRSHHFSVTKNILTQFEVFFNTGIETLRLLFTRANLDRWQFWLFIYISLCIASHIAPSPADIKRVWAGLLAIIGVMLVINFIALLSGVNITNTVLSINYYLSIGVALFIFATIIAFANFLFWYLLLSIYARLFRGTWINPFTI